MQAHDSLKCPEKDTELQETRLLAVKCDMSHIPPAGKEGNTMSRTGLIKCITYFLLFLLFIYRFDADAGVD